MSHRKSDRRGRATLPEAVDAVEYGLLVLREVLIGTFLAFVLHVVLLGIRVAGALIGTGIGNVILRNYEERRDGINMSFAPIASSKGAGLGFQMTF